jgi:hypothetical protein
MLTLLLMLKLSIQARSSRWETNAKHVEASLKTAREVHVLFHLSKLLIKASNKSIPHTLLGEWLVHKRDQLDEQGQQTRVAPNGATSFAFYSPSGSSIRLILPQDTSSAMLNGAHIDGAHADAMFHPVGSSFTTPVVTVLALPYRVRWLWGCPALQWLLPCFSYLEDQNLLHTSPRCRFGAGLRV